MAVLSGMTKTAREALVQVMDLRSADNVFILADNHSEVVAEAFARAAGREGCGVEMMLLSESQRPLRDVPADLQERLSGKTIVLNIFGSRSEEIFFRRQWILTVEETQRIRLGHMPGITAAMLTGGAMSVDYPLMRANAERILATLANADFLRVTSAAGTDFTVGVKGRSFISDAPISVGRAGPLPCGEIICAPQEDRAVGILIADASIGEVGKLQEPLTMLIRDGRIQRFWSTNSLLTEKVSQELAADTEAHVIGELGIGLNPAARVTGHVFEDTKAAGTAHVGFGKNIHFPGGQNRSAIHRDFVFFRPTIEIHYLSGPDRLLMRDGEWAFCD